MEKMKNSLNFFKQDLNNFRKNNIYPLEAINLVENSKDQIIPILNSWNNALNKVKHAFNLDDSNLENLPTRLHQITFENTKNDFHQKNKSKIVIGIAGPGACGKGTLVESLNLPKVVNTTTRPARSYEIDQVHYHFLNDLSFQNMIDNGDFLSVTNRPGRGLYGIEKNSLSNILNKSKVAIIEENPETLFKIQQSVQENNPSVYFSINYILPPQPIVLHLATRLAKRSLESNGDFLNSINSTLGQRQIDEFESLADIAKNGGNVCFFVINNNVDNIASIIKDTYKIE